MIPRTILAALVLLVGGGRTVAERRESGLSRSFWRSALGIPWGSSSSDITSTGTSCPILRLSKECWVPSVRPIGASRMSPGHGRPGHCPVDRLDSRGGHEAAAARGGWKLRSRPPPGWNLAYSPIPRRPPEQSGKRTDSLTPGPRHVWGPGSSSNDGNVGCRLGGCGGYGARRGQSSGYPRDPVTPAATYLPLPRPTAGNPDRRPRSRRQRFREHHKDAVGECAP